MQLGIHPELRTAKVVCSTCGTEHVTRSTGSDLVVEACSACHPAYTGKLKTVAGGSRTARFERRLALAGRA